jgi:hypothetical protein
MSTQLPNIARIEFDAQVKAAYQARAKLRRHVRVKTGVIAGTVNFPRSGRGVATRRIPHTDVVPMNTSFVNVPCTVQDWISSEYTDVFDQQKSQVDERGIVADNVGAAIGRREDQLIIDALDAANAGNTILVGGTGLTDAKLRRAQALFDARAVPVGKRKMAISARAKEDLLGDPRFSSRDFVESYVIRTGQLPQIYGFDIEVIETRDEGGLPIAANVRTCFAWDADAVGLAVGLDGRVSVDWIAEKRSWLTAQDFAAGAVAIDPLGVIEIEASEP